MATSLESNTEISQDISILGVIVRRRCLGRNLAFAEIELQDNDAFKGIHCEFLEEPFLTHDTEVASISKDTKIVKVVFLRSSKSWKKEFDETFPSKPSSLPYGAHVKMDLNYQIGNSLLCSQSSRVSGRVHSSKLLVCSWKITLDPRKLAMDAASQSGMNGQILCSEYLRIRKDNFTKATMSRKTYLEQVDIEGRVDANKNEATVHASKRNTASIHSETRNFPINVNRGLEDGLKSLKLLEKNVQDLKSKGLRAKIFANWLNQTFGLNLDDQNINCKVVVLDIAGGKGQLSYELSMLSRVSCTVVDPLVRKKRREINSGSDFPMVNDLLITKKQRKCLNKQSATLPQHIPEPFNGTNFVYQHNKLLQEARMLVGLHPDECTEDIVDIALKFEKSFAVVPCCVFPSLFKERRLRSNNNQVVRSYDDFIKYLLEKDGRLKMDTLLFQGKNKVIYFKSKGRTWR